MGVFCCWNQISTIRRSSLSKAAIMNRHTHTHTPPECLGTTRGGNKEGQWMGRKVTGHFGKRTSGVKEEGGEFHGSHTYRILSPIFCPLAILRLKPQVLLLPQVPQAIRSLCRSGSLQKFLIFIYKYLNIYLTLACFMIIPPMLPWCPALPLLTGKEASDAPLKCSRMRVFVEK